MIPARVLAKLATLGLSGEQAEAVADMLSEVEAATKEASEAVIEKSRSKVRARVQKWRDLLDIPAVEWIALSAAIKQRDGYRCTYCGSTDEPLHCDHIVPLSQGGTSDPDNLTTACRSCNCGKSGRTVEQWKAGQ